MLRVLIQVLMRSDRHVPLSSPPVPLVLVLRLKYGARRIDGNYPADIITICDMDLNVRPCYFKGFDSGLAEILQAHALQSPQGSTGPSFEAEIWCHTN